MGQIIRESVFNIKYPALSHVSSSEGGLGSRMGNAEYIAFRVPGLDQDRVITRAATDVEQAPAALTQ